jgi:CheY-like chemotaxis protein
MQTLRHKRVNANPGENPMPKVLIVDDSISVRKALERLLAARNMEILVSESGEQAMEVLAAHTPDLIVADVVMPGMSGFDLCRRVKADLRLGAVPVLLISGIVNPEVQAQASDAGALDIIKKPFMPNDVLPLIDRALASVINTKASGVIMPSIAPVSTNPTAPAAISPGGVLKPFLDNPEIPGALVMNMRGQVLAQGGSAWPEVETLVMYFRFLTSSSMIVGLRLEQGELSNMMLEFDGQSLLLLKLEQGMLLVLRLKGANSLMPAKYLARKHQAEIIAELNK